MNARTLVVHVADGYRGLEIMEINEGTLGNWLARDQVERCEQEGITSSEREELAPLSQMLSGDLKPGGGRCHPPGPSRLGTASGPSREEQQVLDVGIAGGHGTLEDDDIPGVSDLEDWHARDGRARVLCGGRVEYRPRSRPNFDSRRELVTG